MDTQIRIGIAGLGTVGAGTARLLTENRALIAARTARDITVSAVSARDRAKDRGLALEGVAWENDPAALAARPDVDLVVELIGGSEGAPKQLVEKALIAGKPVVTANKALIAKHGLALAKLAETSGAALCFEAAVAGGIPIVKALREGLAANRFSRVAGILNGTCNYILTEMHKTRAPFEEVLAEAQGLGYAEADPSFDIDGVDTAHKLSILTALAFNTAPALDAVHIEGIRTITADDIGFAEELGYRIKLLGIASESAQGIVQRVHPCLVPKEAPIASVDGAFNGVVVDGDAIDTMLFEGRGAGSGPTASAVVADIMDIARGVTPHPFGVPVARLAGIAHAGIDSLACSYYIRLVVIDQPGVLAEVTGIFRDEGLSMRSFLQRSRMPNAPVQLVITTHETNESALQRSLERITALRRMVAAPTMIRIENL